MAGSPANAANGAVAAVAAAVAVAAVAAGSSYCSSSSSSSSRNVQEVLEEQYSDVREAGPTRRPQFGYRCRGPATGLRCTALAIAMLISLQ